MTKTRRSSQGMRRISEESFGKLRDLAELTVEMARDRSIAGGYSPKEPYDTGNNRSTIKSRQLNRGEFIVFTESGYGGYLHVGTEKMPPRPYIRDGYNDALREMDRAS